MAKCQMMFDMAVSATEIKNSVESYVGSKTYLKKMVPVFICNIVHNRVKDCDNYFESKQISTLNYMAFKSKLKNHEFSYLFHWSKAAMEALENNYLKDLYFFIKDGDTDEILECYKFSFTYEHEEENNKLKELPRAELSKVVIEKTQEILNAIKKLNDYDKLPNFKFEMELTYHDYAPRGYNAPGFEKKSGKTCVEELAEKDYKNTIIFGKVKTGYHALKCSGKGKIFDSSSEEEQEVNIVDDKEIESVLSLSNTTDTIERTDVCVCGISLINMETVICSVCFGEQHIICLGYVDSENILNNYVCAKCPNVTNYESKFDSFGDAPFQDHRFIALMRLCTMFAKHKLQIPTEIINKAPQKLQKQLWTNLEKLEIIIKENGLMKVNMPKVNEYINNNFYMEKKGKKARKRSANALITNSEMFESEDTILKQCRNN